MTAIVCSYACALILLVLVPQQTNGQATTQITAVEGRSTNVAILCDLDRSFHPLYWDIQELVYDLYSIPKLFRVNGHEAISLPSVDRRMDGWRFQCFTVDLTNPGGLNPGLITILTVFYDASIEAPSEINLLQPSLLGRLVVNYQELQVGPVITTIGWFFSAHPNSSCVVSQYRVALYRERDINNAEFAELQPNATFHTAEQNITISSHILKNGENYFQVSAVEENGFNCATSAYYNKLLYNGSNYNTTRMHVSGTSATFELPEALRRNRSLQLIWSKDDGSQCVCPPVEQFMSRCACNLHNPDSNVVTIADYTITISNLTQEMGEGEVTLHFVSSVSSGCRGFCNLRSIERVYQIIVTKGYPQAPVYNTSNDTLCFNIPNNPIEAEVYDVNLTDSTGALTRLSDVYSTSHCLAITSDLYPALCAPFQVSVAAMNSVGRQTAETTLLPASIATPCACYREKGMIAITSTITPTSADLMLSCNFSEQNSVNLTVIQTSNMTSSQHIILSCGGTKVVTSLMPLSNYTVSTVLRGTGQSCSLHLFTTSQASYSRMNILIMILCILRSF